MAKPLLSIVIANYNYGRFLEEAIQSVISQNAEDQIELIICDAASTDNSLEIIKKYSDRISWWCSEKDGGQSEAFNKGFAHAKGRFLTWLNADDIMLPGAFQSFWKAVESNPGKEWFSGETVYVNAEGRIVTSGLASWSGWFRLLRIPSWARITAPATFFSRRLFELVGGFDEDLRYVMDTDLWIKFSQLGYDVHYLRTMCWAFRLHEESKTSASVTTGVRSSRFMEERTLIRGRVGITPFRNKVTEYGKRFCCIIALSYLTRAMWLKKMAGKNFNDVFPKEESAGAHDD